MNSILLFSIPDIGNDFLSFVQDKGSWLCSFLPVSPFRKAIDLVGNIPYISYINWFIPINEIILILMWWGSAITIYYAYMIVLRWVKAIE